MQTAVSPLDNRSIANSFFRSVPHGRHAGSRDQEQPDRTMCVPDGTRVAAGRDLTDPDALRPELTRGGTSMHPSMPLLIPAGNGIARVHAAGAPFARHEDR